MPEYFSVLSLHEHRPIFPVNTWNFKTSRFQYFILIAEFEIFLKDGKDFVAIDYFFALQTEMLPTPK